jgi:uncharacterized protein (DUF427 family)
MSENLFWASLKKHREAWQSSVRPKAIEVPGPGQESVWDYPRPPAVEPVAERLKVIFAGQTVAETDTAMRIIETASAPVYYFPPNSVNIDCLIKTDQSTFCEWKGPCVYFDLVAGGQRVKEAVYCYPDPLDDLGQGYGQIAGWYAFYPAKMDTCYVGDEKAVPQPGGFYAGWVTSKITGPIKGVPGSEGW